MYGTLSPRYNRKDYKGLWEKEEEKESGETQEEEEREDEEENDDGLD